MRPCDQVEIVVVIGSDARLTTVSAKPSILTASRLGLRRRFARRSDEKVETASAVSRETMRSPDLFV
jgi:hypothetical protein